MDIKSTILIFPRSPFQSEEECFCPVAIFVDFYFAAPSQETIKNGKN